MWDLADWIEVDVVDGREWEEGKEAELRFGYYRQEVNTKQRRSRGHGRISYAVGRKGRGL